MPGVVAVSDLHLGSPSSYLNSQAVRAQLFGAIGDCASGHLDGLFLLGDIIDLTVGPSPRSWVVLREFLEQLAACDWDVESIVYIPGNHDHHIWVQVVEYVELLRRLGMPELKDVRELKLSGIYPYWTPLHDVFPSEWRSRVYFAYPVHHFRDEPSDTRLQFHHGHYCDPWITPFAKRVAEENGDWRRLETYNLPYVESMFYLCSWDAALQRKELKYYEVVDRIVAYTEAVRKGAERATEFLRGLWGNHDDSMGSLREASRHSVDRVNLLTQIVGQEDGPPPSRDIWVLGHSHFQGEYTDGGQRESARVVYDTGGWVLNRAPDAAGGEDAWSEPAVFHWNRTHGSRLVTVKLAESEKKTILSSTLPFKRLEKRNVAVARES